MQETSQSLIGLYGFWVQTGAIIISAICAVLAIIHNGIMAKKRATIDVILQENLDRILFDAKTTVFRSYKNSSLIEIYNSQDKNHDDRNKILLVLNRYEFIAQGIRSKAFDEKIYKRMQYSPIMRMWEMSKPLIEEIRRVEKRNTLYQEFEWLGKRWNKKPLKKCNN